MRDRFGAKNSNWRGGRVAGPGGRIMVYYPKHPGGKSAGLYVLEYRLVVEKKLGRHLRKGEIVHHRNGDIKDNRPENLEVMTQSEHARRHFTGAKRPDKQKWTPAQIKKILMEFAERGGRRAVAKKYGMSESYLSQLIRGKRRRN